MSDRKPIAPVAPVAEVATAEPAVVEVTATEPATTAASVEPTVTEPAVKRTPVREVLGLYIAPARVRGHLAILNKYLESQIAPLREPLLKYYAASRATRLGKHRVDKQEVEYTADELAAFAATMAADQELYDKQQPVIEALARNLIRLSTSASIALASISDTVFAELIQHAIAADPKKKIVKEQQLYSAGVESLKYYNLVKTLPSFQKQQQALASAAADSSLVAHDKELLKRARADFKAEFKVKEPKKQPAPAAAVEPAAPAVVAVAEPAVVAPAVAAPKVRAAAEKNTFSYYITKIFNNVKMSGDGQYKEKSFSAELKSHLNQLATEFIQRVCTQVRHVASLSNIKTVNSDTVLAAVKSLLIDGKQESCSYTLSTESVVDAKWLRADKAAHKDDPNYKVDRKAAPHVDMTVATFVVSYPDSGYDELAALVDQKVKLAVANGVDADAEDTTEVEPATA